MLRIALPECIDCADLGFLLIPRQLGKALIHFYQLPILAGIGNLGELIHFRLIITPAPRASPGHSARRAQTGIIRIRVVRHDRHPPCFLATGTEYCQLSIVLANEVGPNHTPFPFRIRRSTQALWPSPRLLPHPGRVKRCHDCLPSPQERESESLECVRRWRQQDAQERLLLH